MPDPDPDLGPVPEPEPAGPTGPASFEAVADLVESKGEMVLLADLRACVHLVDFEPGRTEFPPTARAPQGPDRQNGRSGKRL